MTHTLTRDYNRLKETVDPEFIENMKRRAGSNKEMQERIARRVKERNAKTGGYKNDIQFILGVSDQFIFVQTSSENSSTINIDIISDKLELYDQLTLEIGELQEIVVKNNKLYIGQKNDDGLFVQVYSIKNKRI